MVSPSSKISCLVFSLTLLASSICRASLRDTIKGYFDTAKEFAIACIVEDRGARECSKQTKLFVRKVLRDMKFNDEVRICKI